MIIKYLRSHDSRCESERKRNQIQAYQAPSDYTQMYHNMPDCRNETLKMTFAELICVKIAYLKTRCWMNIF